MPGGSPRRQPDRRRLPAGLVAVTDDPAALAAAIAGLHGYATADRTPGRPRRGVVYRFVDDREQLAIRHQLYALFGLAAAPAKEADYAVSVGFPHLLDDSAIAHVWNRHGPGGNDPAVLAITLADLQRVPQVVRPRHLVAFSIVDDTPRLAYEHDVGGYTLAVVEELRHKGGLSVKTLYRKR